VEDATESSSTGSEASTGSDYAFGKSGCPNASGTTGTNASSSNGTNASGGTGTNAATAQRSKKGNDGVLKVGSKVVVTRKDKFHGRRGVVVARRGSMFWYVQLDAHGGQKAERIYKMGSSLRLET